MTGPVTDLHSVGDWFSIGLGIGMAKHSVGSAIEYWRLGQPADHALHFGHLSIGDAVYILFIAFAFYVVKYTCFHHIE